MQLKEQKFKTYELIRGKCNNCKYSTNEWMPCSQCKDQGYLELTLFEWNIIDLQYELKEANIKIARYERALKDIASPSSILYAPESNQNIARLALKNE